MLIASGDRNKWVLDAPTLGLGRGPARPRNERHK